MSTLRSTTSLSTRASTLLTRRCPGQHARNPELLRNKLADHTNNVIRPYFENFLAQLPEKPTGPLRISEDGEKLFIPYPSRSAKDESVLLEFGGRNVIAPNEGHPLRPYIAAEVRDLRFPEAIVRVLSPSRTFWEKATLIHVACNRSDPKLDADRHHVIGMTLQPSPTTRSEKPQLLLSTPG